MRESFQGLKSLRGERRVFCIFYSFVSITGFSPTITVCSACDTIPVSNSGGCAVIIPAVINSLSALAVVPTPNFFAIHLVQNGSEFHSFVMCCNTCDASLDLTCFTLFSENTVDIPDSLTIPVPVLANGSTAIIIPSFSCVVSFVSMFGICGSACIVYLSSPWPDRFLTGENPLNVITSWTVLPISPIFVPGVHIFSAEFSACIDAFTKSEYFPERSIVHAVSPMHPSTQTPTSTQTTCS